MSFRIKREGEVGSSEGVESVIQLRIREESSTRAAGLSEPANGNVDLHGHSGPAVTFMPGAGRASELNDKGNGAHTPRGPYLSRSKKSAKLSWSVYRRPGEIDDEARHHSINSFAKLEKSMGDIFSHGRTVHELAVDHERMLLTTLVLPKFHWRVWIHQFLLHFFEPLSTPFLMAHLGTRRAKSQNFIPTCKLFWEYGVAIALAGVYPSMWLMNSTVFFLNRRRFVDNEVALPEIVLFPFCCLVAHKAMVALKYALLTPREYARFAEAEPEQARQWNRQLQLLSGWAPLPDDVLDNELSIAAMRAGVNVDGLAFTHRSFDRTSHDQLLVWDCILTGKNRRAFTATEESSHFQSAAVFHDVKKTLPLRAVLRQFFRFSVAEATLLPPSAAIIPIVIVGLPAMARLRDALLSGESFATVLKAPLGGGDMLVGLTVLSNMYITIFFFNVVLLFLSAGNMHFYRSFLVRCWLTRLVRPVALSHPQFPVLQIIPRPPDLVSVRVCMDNVRALIAALDIISRFGLRYDARVQAYVSSTVLIAVAGLFAVTLNALAAVGDGPSKNTKLLSMGVIAVVCVVVGMAYLMCIAGSAGNQIMENLIARLADARYQVHLLSIDHQDESDEYTEYGELLEFATEKISSLVVSQPIMFMGRVATVDRGYTMVSVVATVVSFAVSQLFSGWLS